MSKTLGALTYPVYLIHNVFGASLIAKFAAEDNKILVYLTTVFIVLLTAFMMNKLIEKNLSSCWKSLLNSTLGRFILKIQFNQKNKKKFKLTSLILKDILIGISEISTV